MIAAPVLCLKLGPNLLKAAVIVLLWFGTELLERLGDLFFVINRYNRLEGVGKNKMEQGFPLRTRSVGRDLQQLASEFESSCEIPELPRIGEQLVLLIRSLFLPPLYELYEESELEWTARMEILSRIDYARREAGNEVWRNRHGLTETN